MSGHADIRADIGHGTGADMRTSPYIGMSASASPDVGEGLDGLFGTAQKEEKARANRIKRLARKTRAPRRKLRRGWPAHVEAAKKPRRKRRVTGAGMERRMADLPEVRARKKPWVQRYAMPGYIELWRRMLPGAWHGIADLYELLPDAPQTSVRAWVTAYLLPRGMAERAPNPDGHPLGRGSQSWLYRRIEGWEDGE